MSEKLQQFLEVGWQSTQDTHDPDVKPREPWKTKNIIIIDILKLSKVVMLIVLEWLCQTK